MSPSSEKSIPGIVYDEPTPAMLATPLILHGSDRFGKTGTPVPVYNPADSATVIGSYHRAETLHLELIEKAAEQGFEAFRRTTIDQRAELLLSLANKLQENAERLALLITREAGKPIQLSRQEVARSIQICRGYAHEVATMEDRCPVVEGYSARISRFPVGPVLAITPYNFPISLIIHKLAPAIAAGCSITIKPAPLTSLTALLLGRLVVEAGYEAISVVPADAAVSEALVRSPVFKKISFTGSAAIGWQIRDLAGRRPLTLELGGNAAVIIEDESRPFEDIAERVVYGAFAYAGQICISIQRILINARVKDEFLPKLVDASRAVKVGDPMNPETLVGPMISMDAMQRARGLLRETLREGGNVVYGGNTFNALTMNPTLLDRITPDMRVWQEEAFAPIAVVQTYDTFEEAIALANQSRYGIQAGVYTADPAKKRRAFEMLEVGGVLINEIPTFRADTLPYGGVKDSGIGREGILAGIGEYSKEKIYLES